MLKWINKCPAVTVDEESNVKYTRRKLDELKYAVVEFDNDGMNN